MEEIFNYKYFIESNFLSNDLSIFDKKNSFNKCIGLMKLYNIKENNPNILCENFEIFREVPYSNHVLNIELVQPVCLNCKFCLYNKSINKFFCHYEPKFIEIKTNNFCSKFLKDFNFIKCMATIYKNIIEFSKKSIFNSNNGYYDYFNYKDLKDIRLDLGRGDCSGLRGGCLKLKSYKKCIKPCFYFTKNIPSNLLYENIYLYKKISFIHINRIYNQKFKNIPKEIFLIIPKKSEFDFDNEN
jgi:hypothetical protein